MAPILSFDRLRSILVSTVRQLPDPRTQPNRIYEMADAALGAFAVFWMQADSFLAYQQAMQRRQGQNNARSLFGLDQVPSDGQIRNLLDTVAPEQLAPPFWRVFEQLREGDYLQAYQGHLGRWLCALDGTQYFSSQKIHCDAVYDAGGQRPDVLQPFAGGTVAGGAGREPGHRPGARIRAAARWLREAGL